MVRFQPVVFEMSASGRSKRWLDKKLKRKQTEPETPPSEAPSCPVGRLKPLEDTEAEGGPQLWHEAPTRNYVRKPVTDDVVHICFHKTTRRLIRPKKDHILRKDPITRKTTRIDLKKLDGGTSTTIVYYDGRGKLIE